jgi:hypothetical protein
MSVSVRLGCGEHGKLPGEAMNGKATTNNMAAELAKLAGFEPAPIMQASGFAGGR